MLQVGDASLFIPALLKAKNAGFKLSVHLSEVSAVNFASFLMCWLSTVKKLLITISLHFFIQSNFSTLNVKRD